MISNTPSRSGCGRTRIGCVTPPAALIPASSSLIAFGSKYCRWFGPETMALSFSVGCIQPPCGEGGLVRRKVMFPRKQAWSTRCKSAPCDLKTTDVDAVRLHGSSTSVSSHFEMPQYRAHAIRYRRKLATHPCPFNGDGSFIDPVPDRVTTCR